jgi:hypothetical protein
MELESVLRKWNELKKNQEILDKKLVKYKNYIRKLMNEKDVDSLSTTDFSITRRKCTKSYLTKESVPDSIWKQYAIKSNYEAFFLTQKKNKKTKS